MSKEVHYDLSNEESLIAQASYLGQRIQPLATGTKYPWQPPMTVNPEGGLVVLYRFGVAVAFHTSPPRFEGLVEQLGDRLEPSEENQLHEETLVLQRTTTAEQAGLLSHGKMLLSSFDTDRLKLIADVLAKSVLLAVYEEQVSQTLEKMEPLGLAMRKGHTFPRREHGLVQHIGEALHVQNRMVGLAQIGEKPEMLWDRPDMEALFNRMEREYEIHERQAILERKLGLIQNTAQTLLELHQTRHALFLEWAIVVLIVIEVVFTVQEHFFK
ncbi:conserved hypothetical protein [Magnetococcus marinus MC-1]|uniref:DUF155 domain-containing protein n=1 Tax=Magnetococcus marinus (strain ATCC BAA-1437 / JCM 17883 / MC-1) TaxID=156889 RepID=A0L458_MAGMM|nr:RMD1 family protein [Magnetococcus marinus]ABK42751.1 conserved hypothetical protein [Magnetococcus marinus MC-1]